MSIDTFLEGLCSLIPRPNTHQIIHRGVLGPNSSRRPHIVPVPDDDLPNRPKNITFCVLMKHGFDLDVLACPCGRACSIIDSHLIGAKYIATISDRKGLARTLKARGLPHHIEPTKPSRVPTFSTAILTPQNTMTSAKASKGCPA